VWKHNYTAHSTVIFQGKKWINNNLLNKRNKLFYQLFTTVFLYYIKRHVHLSYHQCISHRTVYMSITQWIPN
jgi:hypothetical protein